MPTSESPFPAGSTDQEKHDIVRYAFDRWGDFPDARTIGEVIVGLEQKSLEDQLAIPLDDLELITSDPETGEVSLPPTIMSAIERGFSNPIVLARIGVAERKAIARRAAQGDQV
jgi:hypothetical protein